MSCEGYLEATVRADANDEVMMPIRYLERIAGESRNLARAAVSTLGLPVPTCPGWSVDTVVGHLGLVFLRAARMVREQRMLELDFGEIPRTPAPSPERVRWLEEATASLVSTLSAAGPTSPVWNWTSGEQTAGFWHRRLAHETAVHRWDVEGTLRHPSPVATEAAVDGVDELLEVFLPEVAPGLPPGGIGGALALHATDAGAAWRIDLQPATVEVRHGEDGHADAVVSGTASDLMMFVWNRLRPENMRVDGDAGVPARWHELLRW